MTAKMQLSLLAQVYFNAPPPTDHTQRPEKSLFRRRLPFHRSLLALLLICHLHFLKPWMSEIPHASQCLHSGGGGGVGGVLVIYCW